MSSLVNGRFPTVISEMKKTKRWMLISTALLVIVSHVNAAGPFKKVSIATTTTSTTSTTTTEIPKVEAVDEKVNSTSNSKNPKLTGIPQIDYIWDPNLPRELHGFNLSSYPFFSTVPPEEDIHFKCDGLHDGFYASIEFKCQIYHHCVYGIRHDFLCANFTAFDQRTFICHFASDVDCEGSQKYWNRNDALYMATTTTSTTTTTTEPPPSERRRRPQVRPLRPLRRPANRRPIDDYYYEDDQYDDDYYEDRRRIQRPRQRKPVVEYDDEYDEKRSFGDDDKPIRSNSRDRFRDNDELSDDDDTDRHKYDRPKLRNKAKAAPTAERRKTVGRKPGTILGRANADERRSLSDDRQVGRRDRLKPAVDETVDADIDSRRPSGRRRINEKRTPSSTASALDELDDYEKPYATVEGEQDADEEITPKKKTTPKPLEEFVTPKAAPSSVFSRPRAPPRVARPVPINEKKKFQYPIQKATGTTANPLQTAVEEDDYYQQEEEEYDEEKGSHLTADEVDESLPPKRRIQNDAGNARKPIRTTIRKPAVEKRPLTDNEEDYDSTDSLSNQRSRPVKKRRPILNRSRTANRGKDDVDFVDDDYDVQPARPAHRLRPKTAERKSVKRPRLPIVDDDVDVDSALYDTERPLRSRSNAGRRKPIPIANMRKSSLTSAFEEEADTKSKSEDKDDIELSELPNSANPTPQVGRPKSVRVVKRPFLPSRGGSPYLPRGLQPVGIALKQHVDSYTTDRTPLDMGSTISGVRLLEHGAPILRDTGDSDHEVSLVMRTTLPPRSAIPITQTRQETQPKVNLDELYENDYDVTLNDALDPTLKPLTPQHQNYNRNYENIRRRAILPAQIAGSSRTERIGTRIAQDFYDDTEY